MLLAEILKILAAQTETLGYRRADLYEKLFQGILDDNSFGMDDIVKQIFSGSRPPVSYTHLTLPTIRLV